MQTFKLYYTIFYKESFQVFIVQFLNLSSSILAFSNSTDATDDISDKMLNANKNVFSSKIENFVLPLTFDFHSFNFLWLLMNTLLTFSDFPEFSSCLRQRLDDIHIRL